MTRSDVNVDQGRCVSVIIVTHNGASTLGAQLDALIEQDYAGDWEVVVVDNCSTDATQDLLRVYQQRMPRLRWVEARAKKLIPYARNVGVEAARGDRILFCDADDIVDPRWVGAMATALDEHAFVAGRLDYAQLNPLWLQQARSGLQRESLQPYLYPPFLPHAASCNLGFRRSVSEQIGPFDETFSNLSDTDYCWRAQLAGIALHFVPDALVHYRLRGSLKTIFRQGQRYAEYNVLLYKKYRPFGMPAITWRDSARSWIGLARMVPAARSRARLNALIWRFAWLSGRLRGSIKHRIFAL